jgi:tetratricopeptide (TPR) repeat protein
MNKSLTAIFFTLSLFSANAQQSDMLYTDSIFEKAYGNYKIGIEQFHNKHYHQAIERFQECIEYNKHTTNHGTTKFSLHPDSISVELRDEFKFMYAKYYPTCNAIDWISHIFYLIGDEEQAKKNSSYYMLEPLDHTDREIRIAEFNYAQALDNISPVKSDNVFHGKTRLHYTTKQLTLQPCLEIISRKLGARHWKCGIVYYLFGVSYYDALIYDKAEESFSTALSIMEENKCFAKEYNSTKDYLKRIKTQTKDYREIDSCYTHAINFYNLRQYDKAEEGFIFCAQKNAELLHDGKRPYWNKPYYTYNATQWLAHIYHIQGNHEGLEFILKEKGRDLKKYMYWLTPNGNKEANTIEENLFDFSKKVKTFSNQHKDYQVIDSFYNAQLSKYKSLELDNELYVEILVQWARDCGLANKKIKELELLRIAEEYILSKTGEHYKLRTVIDQFEDEDNWAEKNGVTLTGRYTGQTGYKRKKQ